MSTRKRLLAGASAVALAAGATLAGAGLASAQDDEESTGSLSSSSLDLGDTAASLETAAKALNGPVTVAPNEEGGPTVTFTNEADEGLSCLGFTAPYSTIIEQDLDTDYDPSDLGAAIALISGLESGGSVSLLAAGDEGEPISYESQPDVEGEDDVLTILIPLALSGETGGAVDVAAGDDVSWTAPTPDSSALAVVVCVPTEGGDMETFTGIDPQVVADQINGKIPGGSLEIVSPDMISGGSVETGVTVLGSLASASAGDDADAEEPPVEDPAE